MSSKTISFQREIPIRHEVDVCVAGGGAAGKELQVIPHGRFAFGQDAAGHGGRTVRIHGGKDDMGGAGSLCHGWSALPIYYYSLLGVTEVLQEGATRRF